MTNLVSKVVFFNSLYTHMDSHTHIVYIYIYIYREREREEERDIGGELKQEFKSWLSLFAFLVKLILLGSMCIQFPSVEEWTKSGRDTTRYTLYCDWSWRWKTLSSNL